MMSRYTWNLFFLICLSSFLSAQENFPVNGVPDTYAATYLLSNATIHPGNGADSFVGDLLLSDGRIKAVGRELSQVGAVEIDLEGRHIYPSFIDLYAQYGIADLPKPPSYPEQLTSEKPGAYGWNETIRSEFRAHEAFVADRKAAEGWREMGFGALLTHRTDGIARGSGALVFVADVTSNEAILEPIASNHLSLKRGNTNQDYPSSQMGAIALLRQTYLDGQWYAKEHRDVNISLAAWNELQGLPTIFDSPGAMAHCRIDRLGDEFGVQYIIKGVGAEYRRLDAIKATEAVVIIPVRFPDAFDVGDAWSADYATIKDLKHWELAPYNLAMVADHGIPFVITSHGMDNRGDFLPNVRKAVENGLSADAALKALTETPARLLSKFDELGSLEAGKWANLLVTDKPVFESGARIYQNWVRGIAYELAPFAGINVDGRYDLTVGDDRYTSWVSNSADNGALTVKLNDTNDIHGDFSYGADGKVQLSYAMPEGYGAAGYSNLNGWKSADGFQGRAILPGGKTAAWKMVRTGDTEKEEDSTSTESKSDDQETGDAGIGPVIYPFTAYGWSEQPKAETVLFRNATVWTNEEEGILEGADVLIADGRIVSVGRDIPAGKARVIDATGMHLTSGIIDEHSHIAISGGVNEGTQSSSAEVRIGDVVNSEDVNIYRQLAGGVTAAQLLHGSANPIGGQSALIKLRWGSMPEEMKIEGADGFIKFALGENVVRSNWPDGIKRFPQSRMGVEQVFIDHFIRAKAYDAKTGEKRRDLGLEAIAEVLNGERFISCHSYVQSEINMLMKVAERFRFRVKIFTHILEGYKVADKMAEHGAGGSTFSDWWAYKFEVIDAIPHNAALMNEMGVVTAINSDDAEMGRRLNQEAAKAVMYGGASEEDAWKMVTLNPARLLNLDDRMGSIRAGKDADLVLWSDNPLSVYAVAQQTWVDGIRYFDIEEDKLIRESMARERDRIFQKMLEAQKGGAKVVRPETQEEHYYHCDDMEDWCGSDHSE